MEEVQELPDLVSKNELKLFDLEDVTISDSWGTKWTWAEEYREYQMDIRVYSPAGGKASFKVEDESGRVMSQWQTDFDKGLNYAEYKLDAGEASDLEDYKKKDNDKYYLMEGSYTLTVSVGGKSTSVDFEVKKRKKRNERKE